VTGKRRRPSAWQQWKIDRAERQQSPADDVWHDQTQTIPAVRAVDDTEVLAPLRLADDTEIISPVPLTVDRAPSPAAETGPRHGGGHHHAELSPRRTPRHGGAPEAEPESRSEPEPEDRAQDLDERRSRRKSPVEPAVSREAEAFARPMYARALFLRNIDPGPVLCFFFFEGAIAAGATLALAGLVPWWAVAVLPATVAAMVKLNDVVGGSAKRRAGRLAVASGPAPQPRQSPRDPVKEAHMEWRRGVGSELTAGVPRVNGAPGREPTGVPRRRTGASPVRSSETRDVFPYDGRSRELPRDW
jgi:hypothetical protein